LHLAIWPENTLPEVELKTLSYFRLTYKIIINSNRADIRGEGIGKEGRSVHRSGISHLGRCGGGILLTQKSEGQILKVKAFDLLLPASALGPGWGEGSSAMNGWSDLPGDIFSPPRPNNAAFQRSYSNTSNNMFLEWVVVFDSAADASSWYHHQLGPGNGTGNLSSTDEGWYSQNNYESAFRIKNVVVFASVSGSAAASLPLSEEWFKTLLDAQANLIVSATPDPAWNARTPSTLMISWEDINRTEPNAWRLNSYLGGNGSYYESYANGPGATETDLFVQLNEYASVEEAIHEFGLYVDHNDTNHGALGIGDQSYYWSSISPQNQASLGEVVVRKGIYLFDVRWGFNEEGSVSANETQLAINLATLQVSRLP
jgi:hypothetical protein